MNPMSHAFTQKLAADRKFADTTSSFGQATDSSHSNFAADS
jgi:hypothetical protein